MNNKQGMKTAAVAALLTLAMVACSPLRANEPEDKAVKGIQNRGGKVQRDMRVKGKPVIVVRLFGPEVTDAELKVLVLILPISVEQPRTCRQ